MSTKPKTNRRWRRIKIRQSGAFWNKYSAQCVMHMLEPWSAKANSLEKIQAKVDAHLKERHEFPFKDNDGVWYRSVGQHFQSFDPKKAKNR